MYIHEVLRQKRPSMACSATEMTQISQWFAKFVLLVYYSRDPSAWSQLNSFKKGFHHWPKCPIVIYDDLRIMFFMTYIRNTQTKSRVILGSYKPVTIYSKWIWVFFVSALNIPFWLHLQSCATFGMIIPTHGDNEYQTSTCLFREIAPNLSKLFFA